MSKKASTVKDAVEVIGAVAEEMNVMDLIAETAAVVDVEHGQVAAEEMDEMVSKGASTEQEQEQEQEHKKPSRASQIRQLFDGGMSRAEIAKELGVRYQIVYQATKGAVNPHHNGSTTGRNIMVTDSVTGEQMPRREFFRSEYAFGRTRLSLAKEFNVPYQTVYQATRDVVQVKEEEEA